MTHDVCSYNSLTVFTLLSILLASLYPLSPLPAQDPPQMGLRFWLDASDIDADPVTANPGEGEPIDQWIDKVEVRERTHPIRKFTPCNAVLLITDETAADLLCSSNLVEDVSYLRGFDGRVVRLVAEAPYAAMLYGQDAFEFIVDGELSPIAVAARDLEFLPI